MQDWTVHERHKTTGSHEPTGSRADALTPNPPYKRQPSESSTDRVLSTHWGTPHINLDNPALHSSVPRSAASRCCGTGTRAIWPDLWSLQQRWGTSVPHLVQQVRAEFPLKYSDGGILKRAGHTEASSDLALLVGLPPVEFSVRLGMTMSLRLVYPSFRCLLKGETGRYCRLLTWLHAAWLIQSCLNLTTEIVCMFILELECIVILQFECPGMQLEIVYMFIRQVASFE
jgi:hypothetical protein